MWVVTTRPDPKDRERKAYFYGYNRHGLWSCGYELDKAMTFRTKREAKRFVVNPVLDAIEKMEV